MPPLACNSQVIVTSPQKEPTVTLNTTDSISQISFKMGCLEVSSLSYNSEKPLLQEKQKILTTTSQISHNLLKFAKTPFSPEEIRTKLQNIKEEEKISHALIGKASKEFERVQLGTVSALNLESPVHRKKVKKNLQPVIDNLDLEIKKRELNVELNKLGFNPLSKSTMRSTNVMKRVSKALSYLTTPLEYLGRYTSMISNKIHELRIPKATSKFITHALNGNAMQAKGILGKGNFGTIALIESKDGLYALKQAEKDETKTTTLHKETCVHMSLNHPNIVNIHAIAPEGIYLEAMKDGNLLNAIKSPSLTSKEVKKYLLDILSGLTYLHEQGYTHKDLRPENILISRKPTQAKLCDFGLTTVTEGDNTRKGTPYYVAPELVINSKNQSLISNKVDIWSFGIVMFKMITGGEHPYPVKDDQAPLYLTRLLNLLHNPCNETEIFKLTNSGAKKLMKKRDPTGVIRSLIVRCLHGEASERITEAELKSALESIVIKKTGFFSLFS